MARRPPDEERNVAGGAAAPRGGGSGPAIASGGLNFDTAGIKSFTSAMTTAAKAVKEFWAPFEKADRHQRTVDNFFKNLNKQIKEAKKEAAGLDLTGGAGVGRPGSSRVGGDSRMPAIPLRPGGSMVSTHGAGVVGLGWSAREAWRGNQGPDARPFPVTGKVAVAGALTAAAGRMGSAVAERRLPIATSLQQAATQATLVGGTGGQPWSRNYRDAVAKNLTQAQGGWGGVHAAAAQQIGASVGLPQTGVYARQGAQFMNAAKVMSNIDPMGQTEDVAAAGLAGLSSGVVTNSLRAAGIRVSPGGKQRDTFEIFKDLTKMLFGTNSPTAEQTIQARVPDTPRNLQIQELLGNNPALIEQYLKWLESSRAAGAPISTLAESEKAAGAQGLTGRMRRAEAQKGRTEGRLDRGILDTAEGAEALREKAYKALDGVFDKMGGLVDWLGKASMALKLLTGAITPLIGVIGGAALGRILGGAGGAAGAAGKAGILARGAGAVAGVAAPVAAAGGAALAGAAIGTGIANIGVGGGNDLSGWLGDRSSGVLDTMGFLGDTGEAQATGGGRHRTHKGKKVYKGKTRYGVDLKKGGPTSYHDYGKGPFPELKPDAKTKGDVGDPVIGASWNPAMHGADVGDPVKAGALPGQGWDGLNSDFKSKLQQMFADNPRLSLTSGFRSYASQERLYKRWKARVPGQAPAAPPGKSNHEKGVAADIGPRSEYAWLAANAPKYGLKKPMSYEPWHWEPSNIVGGTTTPDTGAGGSDASAASSGGAVTGSAPAASGGLDPSLSFGSGLFGGGTQHTPGGSLPSSSSASSAAGGAAPSDISATGAISVDQALRLAKAAGFTGEALKTMVAIAMAESGLRADAKGDVGIQTDKWGPSVGLWQVRTLKADQGKGTSRDMAALLADPMKQARAAHEISGGGKNFQPWSVYTSGKYKANMAAVESAMKGSGGGDKGDPVFGTEDTPVPQPVLGAPMGASSGRMGVAPGGGGGVVIHHASFTVEIASASPEDAERAARQIMDLLSNNQRLMEAAES